MKFTLKLVSVTPDALVLAPETPLSGVKFLEEAGRCLRRNLDGTARCRHQTMGALSTYEISVPQHLAIESGYFENASSRYIPCEHAFLNKFIFHAANYSFASGGNRCYYPYYSDELVLTSYIDELAVLDTWRSRGYPDKLDITMDSGMEIPFVPEADDIVDADIGDLVLDDLSQ